MHVRVLFSNFELHAFNCPSLLRFSVQTCSIYIACSVESCSSQAMATVTVLRLCLAPLAHALQTAWQPLARLAKYLCSLSFREMREIVLQYVQAVNICQVHSPDICVDLKRNSLPICCGLFWEHVSTKPPSLRLRGGFKVGVAARRRWRQNTGCHWMCIVEVSADSFR